MSTENVLADKIGELGTSLASIKEQVGNLGADFTEKLKANGEVSSDLKEKTDKALSDLGAVVTRVGELEKRAAREKEMPTDKVGMDLGDHLVASDAYKNTDKAGGWRGSIKVGVERAAITSGDGTVGAGRSAGTSLVPGMRVPGILGLPQRKLTIRDLVAPGQTSSNSVEYVKAVGFTNNARPVTETTQKPTSDVTFNLFTSPVRTLAHLFKVSRQIMDDAPGLASYINGEGTYGLKYVEENQLLNGNGTGQNLNGIVPQATAYAPSFNPSNEQPIDRLRLAILQAVLSNLPASGIVLNPVDWARIELTKDAEQRYIVGSALSPIGPTLWSLPVVESQAMTAGEFLTGSFNMAAQIFDRMGVEVLLSTENTDDFEKNMATVRIEERLAFIVKRPEAFITGDIDTITTAD